MSTNARFRLILEATNVLAAALASEDCVAIDRAQIVMQRVATFHRDTTGFGNVGGDRLAGLHIHALDAALGEAEDAIPRWRLRSEDVAVRLGTAGEFLTSSSDCRLEAIFASPIEALRFLDTCVGTMPTLGALRAFKPVRDETFDEQTRGRFRYAVV